MPIKLFDGSVNLRGIENRIVNLENRFEKFLKNFKISAVEFERGLSEGAGPAKKSKNK